MALVRLPFQPGFFSQPTQAQNAGGWWDGNLVRWRQGLLEKIGGWRRLNPVAALGLIRAMHGWEDLDKNLNLLVGGDGGPQLLVNTVLYGLGVQAPITGGDQPADAQFSVALANQNVTVLAVSPLVVGEQFVLQMSISVGGFILPVNMSNVVTVKGPTSFQFQLSAPSTVATASSPGIPLFTNTALNTITATWQSHNLVPTDPFTFEKRTRINDVPNGTALDFPQGAVVTVLTTPTADTFTFSTVPFGPAPGLGSFAYMGQNVQINPTTTPPTNIRESAVLIALGTLDPLGDPQVESWHVDNLGEDGLMVKTAGPLWVYHPPVTVGPYLNIVGASANTAPQSNNGMFVAMPQAQVILWGTEPIMGAVPISPVRGTIDPLLLRWSDAGTYDVYIPAVTNQAGSYRLSRGSTIKGGIQAPQTTLMWTDVDVWSMSYVGPPLIYGFTVMGTGCGLVGPHAMATLGRTTFWQSQGGIWQFGDGGVQQVPCSVWDYLFNDLDTANINKCFAAANSFSHEVAFFFPSLTTETTVPTKTNFLLYSQRFDIVLAWWITRVVPFRALFASLGINAPDGTDTATLLTDDLHNGLHCVGQFIQKALVQQEFTASVYCHKNSTRNLEIYVTDVDLGNVAYALFNPTTGTLVSSGAFGTGYSVVSTSVHTDALATGLAGNGWLRYELVFVTDDFPTIYVLYQNANGTANSYVGDGASGVIIWGAMLNRLHPAGTYVATLGVAPENECTRYIKYNTVEKLWDKGILQRSAWIDNNVFGTALGGDVNFRIQQHERGYDDDDQPMRGVFAETGYNELGDGTMLMVIDEVHPDFKWFGMNGGVSVSFKGINYPNDEPTIYGPYSTTDKTRFFKPDLRARMTAVRYDWAEIKGFSARVGASAYRLKPAGKLP